MFNETGGKPKAGALTPVQALDFQVCQRVLPRLRGGAEAEGLLDDLLKFCKKHHLGDASARVERMQHQLGRHMSFSFWTS